MQHPPAFGYTQIAQEMMRGLLDTVSDRQDLSEKRKDSLRQTAVCTVMAYNPRDPLEVIQSVVYDQIVHDGARDLLRGQAELIKLRARPSILAAGKTFLAAMEMVLRLQHRPEHTLAFARPLAETQPAPAPAMAPAEAREPEAAAGVMEPVAARREPASQPEPVAADTGPSPDQPSPGAMEAPSPAVPIATRGEAAEAGGGTPETMPRPGVAAHHGGHGAAAERAPRVTPIAAARRPGIAPSGLAAEPLLSDQDIERILMDGLDPAEQQDIRDAVARTLRAAGHAVG